MRDAIENPLLADTVDRLAAAGGDRLLAVVLYGEAARGDRYADQELDLMVVLRDLEPATLAPLGDVVRRWVSKGQPMPRFFSPRLIAASADVFPIELLEISEHRVILYGGDPLADLDVHTDHLRIQCERELREKLMRLAEGYLQAHGRDKAMRALLCESFVTFVRLFRGCLRLLDERVPAHDADVVALFCRRADLDPAPLERVRVLRAGGHGGDLEAWFRDYYRQLSRAVDAVDRFVLSDSTTGDVS